MNRFLIVFFTSVFFYYNAFALTIVAKVAPSGKLYLDKDDPYIDTIFTILHKYQFPVSCIECTDEERREIFKDNIPFAQTVFIKKKVREVTHDNSWKAIWIPPLLAQAYALYCSKKSSSMDPVRRSKEMDKLLTSLPLYKHIVYNNFSHEKTLPEKHETFKEIFRKINDFCYKDKTYYLHYIQKILSFLNDYYKSDNRIDVTLNIEDSINLFYRIIPKSIELEITQKENFIYDIITKEYAAEEHNMALFSRSINPFMLSHKEIDIITYDQIISTLQKKRGHKHTVWYEHSTSTIHWIVEKIREYFKLFRTVDSYVYFPFDIPEKYGYHLPEYSVSFGIHHLDGFENDKFACSLAIALLKDNPIFYFSLPLSMSFEDFYNRGFIVPAYDELVSPFLFGKLFHGRMLASNYNYSLYETIKSHEYAPFKGYGNALPNNNKGELNKVRGYHGYIPKAALHYFMMPLNKRLSFDSDVQLQKLLYAYLMTSTIANTFDIVNIDFKKGEEIKTNQKKLAEYYQKAFLNRIKELASKEINKKQEYIVPLQQSSSASVPNRLSMIGGHLKK